MTAKIKPWMMEAAKQIDEIYIRADSILLQEGIAPIIAAHAPKQEGKECTVCGELTDMCCSDCAIDSGGKAYTHVCTNNKCLDKHEKMHAPEQEPSVPVGRLKLALVTATDLANDILYLIHQAEEINGK